MYLLLLTLGMGGVYVGLFSLFPYFFKNTHPALNRRSLYSILYIFLFSLLVYTVSFSLTDQNLGNRIMHTFGGGFLAFFTCFLAVRDSQLRIGKFQFFLFSFLIVISLGVANEIMEFILQNHFNFIFSQTINDTWWDLTSNLIGALIASAILIPFIKKSN